MTPLPPLFTIRRHVLGGFAAMVILVIGFGIWSLRMPLGGAVITSGRIEGKGGHILLQHPQGGQIRHLAIHEGQEVVQGDLILQLDDQSLRDERKRAAKQLSELQSRIARLEAERDLIPRPHYPPALRIAARDDPDISAGLAAQEQLFQSRRNGIAQELQQLENRITHARELRQSIMAQSHETIRQKTLIRRELENQQQLYDKGIVAQSRVLALQREEARLEALVQGLQGDLAQLAGQIEEARLNKLRLPAQRREEVLNALQDNRFSAAQIELQIAALDEQIAQRRLLAPQAGRILGLAVKPQQSVLAATEPIASLLPKGQALIATAALPVQERDNIQTGQAVQLLLSGPQNRLQPDLFGKITQISVDSLQDQKGQSFYHIEVALPEDTSQRLGKDILPGMAIEMFIATQERHPIDYLLEPFSRQFRRIFRET